MNKRVIALCAVLTALVLSLTSCQTNVKSPAKLDTDEDSVAYALGVLNFEGLPRQLAYSGEELDPDMLMKGLTDGIKLAEKNIDREMYMMGVQMGMSLPKFLNNLPGEGEGIDLDVMLKAVGHVLYGKERQISSEDAGELVNLYFETLMQKDVDEKIAADEKFVEELRKDPDLVTTESGLMYKITKMGDGEKPTEEDTVLAHYEGSQVDGTVFDSSYDRGEPTSFPLSGVIAGWTEGFQYMPEGSEFTLYIPADLAYGEHTSGGSGRPQGLLIFKCELIEVIKAEAEDDIEE